MNNKTVARRSFFFLVPWVLGIFALAAIGGAVAFHFSSSLTLSERGQLGDFLGGVLNPSLTFLTFIGILIALYIQHSDLILSRQQLERSATAQELQVSTRNKQAFDEVFFRMLQLHNDIVNSIDLVGADNKITKGRDCFRVFYTRLGKYYRAEQAKQNVKYTDSQLLRRAYRLFWAQNQLDLGHYYRYLYNAIRFVDTSEYRGGYHIKLVRAQLSDQELLLLFYNCLSDAGANFKALAEKHALFDNMSPHLLDHEHSKEFASAAFGPLGYVLPVPSIGARADS